MSYLVLARKYRPQTFEDVVGQNPVSQTLLNALETGRVAHAYIFSGPRGVGKTTTARILAKCLNCVKGPTKIPCNTCDACLSISQSNSTDDVLEIDGASNRGIEQIRELRDTAKYAPAKSRYRIFIIDEAHQITKDAFGALLKTLEEPPSHVVFMMATTEVQKIPAPILSRCQRFALRPISAPAVFEHLKDICRKEKVKVDEAALADIVRFVEGSLRDALSLLDQALVFSPEGITSTTIRDLLGLLPADIIQNFATLIQEGDPSAVLKSVHGLVQEGIDLTQLAKDLQQFYHSVLLRKAGVEDAFKLEAPQIASWASRMDFPTLERNIRLLARSLDEMRHSDTPRAVFEIYSLRLAQKTLDPLELVQRLEKMTDSAPPVPAPKPISSLPARATASISKEPEEMAPPPPPAVTQTKSTTLTQIQLDQGWSSFQQMLAQKKGAFLGAFEDVIPTWDGNRLLFTFPRSFAYDLASRSLELLRQTLAECFGTTPPFDLKLDKSLAPKPDPASPPHRASLHPSEPVKANDQFEEVAPGDISPDIQKALKHFPGTVKKGRKS